MACEWPTFQHTGATPPWYEPSTILLLVDLAIEREFREAAFAWLRSRMLVTPVFTRADLGQFEFRGERTPLVEGQRGIHRPRALSAALSIITTYVDDPARRPYADEMGEDGLLRYKWMGTDGDRAPNRALRAAMEAGLPLVWFQGVGFAPGGRTVVHQPVMPVYLIAEEPERHQFVVALDSTQQELVVGGAVRAGAIERRYNERLVRERVHQPYFREMVLSAYQTRCAICRLPVRSLLDAAHIKPDADGGAAHTSNGLALCKIHHGAFDAYVLGIDPGYTVHVGRETLETFDGPTLKHALKEMHGSTLGQLPTRRSELPDRDLLAEKFERFQSLN